MGYLIVRFNDPLVYIKVKNLLETLHNVEFKGDWYEMRRAAMLKAAKQVGVREDSAPFQSLNSAQARLGPSEHVSIRLKSRLELQGDLSRFGILVSNREIDAKSIREDGHIQEFLSRLNQLGDSIQIDTGG